MVIEDRCPWCEAEIEPAFDAAGQTCAECLTTWKYEDLPEADLALAA